ncbi:SigE family RNA polymerase sigma factor [Pedococcus ginsenosidimutans]|uniref:SigE family RNA polymerase sigma factor n=1 Tax=Pedococcus ginsenosidimutans TaxID=490570 RepID=A0ABP8XXH9_9MICO
MNEVTAVTEAKLGPTFEEYVATRGASLLHTAWLLTGDHQRAEDLVQTALGKTWPHWSHIAVSEGGSYDAYVRKVMMTTYIAWWRRRWTAEYPTASLPERPASASGTPEAETTERRRDLLAALAPLPRGQRAVVVLRYFYDLSEAQTAEALGCTVGTVKSQSSRALAALRNSPALRVEEVRDV